MTNGIQPLSEADLTQLNESLTALDEAERLIEQAKRAGIDTGDQGIQAKESREKLMRIKQTFFPGR